MNYRKEIDGLRAFAVMPVVLFHAGFETFSGGFVGVDVFFVISGYLITSIILSDMEQGKFSIINFYERRARRILPALFFVMLCCLPFAWYLLTPASLKDFCQSLVATSVYSSNILFWQESGYFGVDSELKPLIHTWSLAVEEQYYLFFPPLLMLLWVFRKRFIFLTLMIIGAISLLFAQWSTIHFPLGNFFLLPSRIWELSIGALSAFYLLYSSNKIHRNKIVCNFLSFIGLMIIVLSIIKIDDHTPFPGIYALFPTLGTALIILAATKTTITAKFLSLKPIVFIGLLSYSIYLWHQPLFAFLRHYQINAPSTAALLGLSLLSIALAYLSWRYIEVPFRDKQKIPKRKIFILTGIGSLCFMSIGVGGHLTNGFYDYRVMPEKRKMFETSLPSPKREECHTSGIDYRRPQNTCMYNNNNTTWATFGDSHTVELAYALAQKLEPFGEGIRHFSFSGCKPSYPGKSAETPCAKWTNEAVNYIITAPEIKSVVVSYRINQYLSGKHDGYYPNLPPLKSEQEIDEIISNYIAITDKFVQADKNVYLVIQAPELPVSIDRLIMKERGESLNILGSTTEWWKKRNKPFMSRLSLFNPKIKIIDPKDIFCDTKLCYATINGESMYFDSDHMSIYGAKKVVDMIIDN